MRVTILGCGTSGGVPRPGGKDGLGEWGAANPQDGRNRRRRCSILVQDKGKTVLVDTSPDVRAQLLDARVERVDAVVWTHDHADQVHGIDDMRPFARRQGEIECWADQRTYGILLQRFGYCFEGDPSGHYKPIYRRNLIEGPFVAAGLPVVPFAQDHGAVPSLGFRFGRIAYANDVVALPQEAFVAMAGVEVLIVDALRYQPHPTHAHLERTLEWIGRLKPKRAILTHMHIDLDYEKLRRELPANVIPAYDGMQLTIES